MRHGLTILPEHPWREAAPMWRAAEDLGFDHAWTYDHLVWSGLPDQTWFAAVPTLAAAATVTERIGLGTFVSSPNYRHPYTYARDILTLHDLTEGRFICGVGTGGTLDSGILGETLTVRERVDRFDARTLPGPVRSSVPLVVAANGPRALRLAAAYGEGWVTTGTGGDDLDAWFQGVAALTARLDDALAATGRAEGFARYLSLDASPRFALQSADLYAEMVGRAGELGFTDVITHWPRPDGPYAGDVRVLETVAATLG